MWMMTSPLLYYGLLAAGLGLCLFLFLTLKRDLRAAEARLGRRLEGSLEGLREELKVVKTGLREAEERAGVLVPPTPPRSGLNLARRAHVLRLVRRGDPPEQIAAALGLPQGEVDLLLKVHRLVVPLPGN